MAVTFRTSATSTGATITVPSTVQAGDILFLQDIGINNSSSVPTTAVPSGFTLIATDFLSSSFSRRAVWSFKIASGSDASTSITGMSGSAAMRKILAVFNPGAIPQAVTPQDAKTEFTSGNPAAQTVTAQGGKAPLIVLGGYIAADPIAPRTFTPTEDGELSNTTGMYLKYKIYDSSPQNVTVDMDDEGSDNCLFSCYLEIGLPSSIAPKMMHYRRLRI